MSIQHCQPRSRTQNMFCIKDGRKYFDKTFKQLFRHDKTSSAVLAIIENEANTCSVKDMAESSGETLLHLAAKYGHDEVATYLISNGCDVDARNGECGWTPLMVSAAYGHATMCRLLLEANADMFATNFLGESALYLALWNMFDPFDRHLCVFYNRLKCIELSNEEMATKLIQANSPMFYIVHLDKAEVTRIIRERGYTAPKSLVPEGMLLHDAVSLMNLENVKFVLEKIELDVNFLDNHEYAPMHYAVENGDANGNVSIIKSLLDKGADINVQGIGGMTPLFAVFNGYLTIEQKIYFMYFLLQQGADPQMLNFHGDTVIDYAMDEAIEVFDETLLDPVLSHLALQEALGLPIIDRLREQIDSTVHKYFYNSCKQCLEYMKRIKVERDINLYKILTESDEKILQYMRDPQIATTFIHTIFDNNFYYRYVMRKRFTRVMDIINKEKERNSV